MTLAGAAAAYAATTAAMTGAGFVPQPVATAQQDMAVAQATLNTWTSAQGSSLAIYRKALQDHGQIDGDGDGNAPAATVAGGDDAPITVAAPGLSPAARAGLRAANLQTVSDLRGAVDEDADFLRSSFFAIGDRMKIKKALGL